MEMAKSAALAAASFLLMSLPASSVRGQEAKQLYEKNCVSCHGASGKGDGPAGQFLQPKPADFATALKGKGDADIAKVIKVIKEGGAAVGKSPVMPAFKATLNDEQIQGLVRYLKGLSSP